jgi:hypothetical protein
VRDRRDVLRWGFIGWSGSFAPREESAAMDAKIEMNFKKLLPEWPDNFSRFFQIESGELS